MTLDRWQILGYLFSFVNPVLGFLMGIALFTNKKDKDHKATGSYVMILSIIMAVAWAFVIARLQ